MYGSYSTTLAPEPILPWVKDTWCSRLSYVHDLAMVRSLLFIPFDSASSSTGNLINPSSTAPCSTWETPSLRERCCSFDTSPRNSSEPDRKSLMPVPKSDTRSRSRYWPAAPSPPHDRPWTLPSSVSNRPEPTTPSTRVYFAKPFGMSATMRQWSTRETDSTANYKREDDHPHQIRSPRILHLPTSPLFWHDSTTHLCTTCSRNRSSKTVETTMDTTSEVTVFIP